jgi:hypothetical protein
MNKKYKKARIIVKKVTFKELSERGETVHQLEGMRGSNEWFSA